MSDLTIQHLRLDTISPNPWNPNKQTERQYEAEIESILDNGFIAPIIVRENPDDAGTYEVIDGEHRHRALSMIVAEQRGGNGNIAELTVRGVIPAVVLDIDDARARRLTVILNETRGNANTADLAQLLSSIADELGDSLITGLPYTPEHLADLLKMGEYDWEDIAAQYEEGGGDGDDDTGGDAQHITATLDDATYAAWKDAVEGVNGGTYTTDQKVAGALIARLLINY